MRKASEKKVQTIQQKGVLDGGYGLAFMTRSV